MGSHDPSHGGNAVLHERNGVRLCAGFRIHTGVCLAHGTGRTAATQASTSVISAFLVCAIVGWTVRQTGTVGQEVTYTRSEECAHSAHLTFGEVSDATFNIVVHIVLCHVWSHVWTI